MRLNRINRSPQYANTLGLVLPAAGLPVSTSINWIRDARNSQPFWCDPCQNAITLAVQTSRNQLVSVRGAHNRMTSAPSDASIEIRSAHFAMSA